VFIDAPGTGFGKIAGKDKEKAFWGVDPDADAFADFITQFLSKYGRWNSPKFLFGESYGTTRSAVLARLLVTEKMVDLNGVILLSQILIFDGGTGLRLLGKKLVKEMPLTAHLFFSHVHWDHIMGLPFFTPAYIAGNHLRIYGGHASLEMALRRQQDRPSFPVDFSAFKSSIEFVHVEPGRPFDVAGMRVVAKLQSHAGDSYGYRFEHGGRSLVYSTDSEHKLQDPAETTAFVEFFREADLVVFDAMYSFADAVSVRADWGHSSNIVGVELCQMARARHLCLFHHECAIGDEAISRLLADAQRLEELTSDGVPLRISAAYDGLEIAL
jgi:phosphoribosyl 1,2-cyclic phosphodiesterase